MLLKSGVTSSHHPATNRRGTRPCMRMNCSNDEARLSWYRYAPTFATISAYVTTGTVLDVIVSRMGITSRGADTPTRVIQGGAIIDHPARPPLESRPRGDAM